jgi:hypothetical protein
MQFTSENIQSSKQTMQNLGVGANAVRDFQAQSAFMLAQQNAFLATHNAMLMRQREQMEYTMRCHLLATIGAPPGLSLEPDQQVSPSKATPVTDMWELSTTCSSRQRSASPTSSHSNSGDSAKRSPCAVNDDQTTLIVKNLVSHCTRDMLFQFLDNNGFRTEYNLVYLPRCFATERSFHYAFVNFVSASAAVAFQAHFNGCENVEIFGENVADISWSECQGLSANIAKYRNSSVMHHSVPDECRPLLIQDGKVVAFPKPTKKIKEDRRTRKAVQESKEV